jgi:Ca2+-binding EF-hand superfamily protein
MQAFFALDKLNQNGQVDWSEWLSSFQKELSASELTERQSKEKVAAAKAAWAEAARTNPDHLNIDEFLAFTHPEFSHPLILQRVDEMLLWSDANKDGSLSGDEYARARRSVPDAHDDFALLDADGDGALNRRELIVLHDAKSQYWSASEAKKLLSSWDADKDSFLQLHEFTLIPSSIRKQHLSPDKMFHDVF